MAKSVPRTKWFNEILITLVREYGRDPMKVGEKNLPGIVKVDIVRKAHLITADEEWDISNPRVCEILKVFNELSDQNLVQEVIPGFGNYPSDFIIPTQKGIETAQFLMRPWYRKVWDLFKGDIRTIVVAIITALLITILTNCLLNWLGWK